jgi:hypothetical protein
MDGITKPMMDCLETTAWGMKHFGGIITNRVLPHAVMRQCVKAGLCRCEGMNPVCDDDGSIMHSRRERLSYVLTDEGQKALNEFYADQLAALTPPTEGAGV